MKFLTTIILTIFVSNTSFGQKYPQALVDSFSNVTIEYYYADRSKPTDSLKLSYRQAEHFILKSELTETLKSKFEDFTVFYVTQQDAINEFAKTKNRTGLLEKISVTELQDTINIDIDVWSVSVTKVKRRKGKIIPIRVNLAASCRGTLGYTPTCRFVYDKTKNKWIKHTLGETVASIMKASSGDVDE